MVQLNASTLPSVKMARGVAPKTKRVIQFGEGGFLRAFCDWMIDMANEKAGMDAGVVIVQPIERGMVSMLNEQDGLYTLILRGQVDGKPSKDERIIQSVKRGLSPYEDFEGYLALAHNPDMRIIISNTTEAGIVYTGKDSFDDKPQASYPGKLTRLLYERFTAFGGKKGTGFILLPCELIDYNGRNLEERCLKTAEQWGLSEAFKTWLKEENVFCSTLVDRIVTGYPRGEAETLYEEFGYRDNMLDTAEPFGLWVIEGPAWIEDELPFRKAGCNVIFTQDVSPYSCARCACSTARTPPWCSARIWRGTRSSATAWRTTPCAPTCLRRCSTRSCRPSTCPRTTLRRSHPRFSSASPTRSTATCCSPSRSTARASSARACCRPSRNT